MEVFSIVLSTAACFGMPGYICDAQITTGLDPRLLYSVCLVESSGNIHAYVAQDGISPSYGLCQIKLNTARLVGFTGNARQLMRPGVNAHYAAKYLVKNLKRYKNIKKAISAYNAGRAVDFNAEYVEKVMKNYRRLAAQ